MDLNDKVALVTGGGRGIGRATAQQLAAKGVSVAIAARSTAELDEVVTEIEASGGRAIGCPTDVTDKAAVHQTRDRVMSEFGRIDILVNNAGVAIHNPIVDVREEDWDLNIAVNLKGTFLCTQAVFAHMCERGSGHIVNVSSVSGNRGHVRGAAYCAAKAGAIALTETTDAEGRPHGVKATVICPGPVDTRMRRENHPNDVLENLGQPEGIADAILFVLSQPDSAHTIELIVRTPLM